MGWGLWEMCVLANPVRLQWVKSCHVRQINLGNQKKIVVVTNEGDTTVLVNVIWLLLLVLEA